MMFVGITTHFIYGVSGNELPPPIRSSVRTAELIDVDTPEEAISILARKVLPMREAASKICEPYSSPDGYSYEVLEVE